MKPTERGCPCECRVQCERWGTGSTDRQRCSPRRRYIRLYCTEQRRNCAQSDQTRCSRYSRSFRLFHIFSVLFSSDVCRIAIIVTPYYGNLKPVPPNTRKQDESGQKSTPNQHGVCTQNLKQKSTTKITKP